MPVNTQSQTPNPSLAPRVPDERLSMVLPHDRHHHWFLQCPSHTSYQLKDYRSLWSASTPRYIAVATVLLYQPTGSRYTVGLPGLQAPQTIECTFRIASSRAFQAKKTSHPCSVAHFQLLNIFRQRFPVCPQASLSTGGIYKWYNLSPCLHWSALTGGLVQQFQTLACQFTLHALGV